jgi:hypothetical protein|nr:DUF3426 domain-containing protein [Thiothrix litoralis]
MKELTAAQGLLRCGECDNIFDAMKNLSQTLPEERRFAKLSTVIPAEIEEPIPIRPARPLEKLLKRFLNIKSWHSRYFLIIGVSALVLLLILQVLYISRNWLAQQPMTSALTQQLCALMNCDVTIPRDVRAISLLSRNIYSHPNAPKVLTISASIQNNAAFPQPYPLIEISFLDKNNKVLALRRFPPEEYMHNFTEKLMPIGVPDELILNITDPGEDAIRFQFRFM